MSSQTDKNTGTDLTEICQNSCKIAIRKQIERVMERGRIKEENADGDDIIEGDDDNVDDSMPEILSRHFESAARKVRKFASDKNFAQYASFA